MHHQESVSLACRLDGSTLHGLNLRVAPRKEKPPQVRGNSRPKFLQYFNLSSS